MSFFLVTGRIEGDDEDTAMVFECGSAGEVEATVSFEQEMRKLLRDEQAADEDGDYVLIITVARSETPISILRSPA